MICLGIFTYWFNLRMAFLIFGWSSGLYNGNILEGFKRFLQAAKSAFDGGTDSYFLNCP